jgi:alkylation response protein AidB-like acyl-CoA dehydrogenase
MERHGPIGLSEEQIELLESARKYCRDKSGIETVRHLIDDELGHDPKLFAEMAELGWLGIAIPESLGGAGLELAEVVPVVEQMGRALMSGPLLSTTLAAQALLAGGTREQQAKVLPELVAGTPATLALMERTGGWDPAHIAASAERRDGKLQLSGTKSFVLDGAVARWILVSVQYEGAPALVLLDHEAIEACGRRRERVIDETRRSVQLSVDGVAVAEEALLDPDRTAATFTRIELAGSLLAVAEMCGGGASCIDETVAYLNARKQFGRPIGSYQALKHPVVHAHLGLEQARSHLYAAAHTFEKGKEGEIAVRMAKAQAGPAFAFAADRAIQFHGGYGFTYECDAQLYRRRALWCESQYGDALHHRRKLADLIL